MNSSVRNVILICTLALVSMIPFLAEANYSEVTTQTVGKETQVHVGKRSRDITAEVQAGLNAGGVVKIYGGGTGYISQTLIIKNSSTHIIVEDNTTLKWTHPSYAVMLRTVGGAHKWDSPMVGKNILDDISIEGGIWDLGGCEYSKSANPGFLIVDATHVKLKDMKVLDAWKFFFGFGGLDGFVISDITMHLRNTSIAGKDGFHFAGGIRNGVISNIRGNTTDDLIALNFGGDVVGDDATNYMIRVGDSYNVTVRDIYSNGAWEAVRILADDMYKCTDITIDGIYGNVPREHCVSISGWKYKGHTAKVGTVTISNVHVYGTNLDNPNYSGWKNPLIMLGNPWKGVVHCDIDSLILRNINVVETEGHIQTPVRVMGDVTVNTLIVDGLTSTPDKDADLTGYAVIDIGDSVNETHVSTVKNLVFVNSYIAKHGKPFDGLVKIQNPKSSLKDADIRDNVLGIELPKASKEYRISNNIMP